MTVRDVLHTAGATPVHLHCYNDKGTYVGLVCSDSADEVDNGYNPTIKYLDHKVEAIHAVVSDQYKATIVLDIIVWGE